LGTHGRTGTILKTKPIIGYSDITPGSRIARWLAAMETMTDRFMWRS
jgi:hypothetical protein